MRNRTIQYMIDLDTGLVISRVDSEIAVVLLVEGAAFALAREKQSRPDPMRWPDFGDPLQAEEWEDHNESEKG